ncbi:MAG: SDR family oxidoreductase [Pseudomonadota bacterium]
MSDSLENKVIVITGAASGIGAALAAGFARDGAHVIGFDPNVEGLTQTANHCSGQMTVIAGDVTNDADIASLVTQVLTQHQRIDVLINNAGIANQGNLIDQPFESWQAVIDVNLTGLARCIYHILPHMIGQGYGRIVNVCSREGETGRRTLSAYSSSKGGVAVLTKSLARELTKTGHDDVLISGLIPGGTRTNMNKNESMQAPEEVYPHTRFIVQQPKGSTNGRVFFRSQDYEMFTAFNEERARIPGGR